MGPVATARSYSKRKTSYQKKWTLILHGASSHAASRLKISTLFICAQMYSHQATFIADLIFQKLKPKASAQHFLKNIATM